MIIFYSICPWYQVRLDSVLYNDDTKLVTTVTLVYEFTQIAVFRTIDTSTQLLDSSLSENKLGDIDNPILYYLVVFFVCVLVDICRELLELKSVGLRKYFKLSKLVVVFELVLCVAMLELILHRDVVVLELLEEMRETRFKHKQTETYVNIRFPSDLYFLIQLVDSALIVLLLVELGIHSQGYQFPQRALKIIVGLTSAVVFPLLVMALFALVGYALFIDTEKYTSLFNAFYNVLIFMFRTKETDNRDLWCVHPEWGKAYAAVVGFLMEIVIVNAFLIEFVHVYERVRHESNTAKHQP